MYGTYLLGAPQLVINDPEIMKQFFIKDFHTFADRIGENGRKMFSASDGTDRIWAQQLSMAEAEPWKDIRSTFSPIFTSGKLKAMVPLINHVRDKLMEEVGEKVEADEEFELKELLGKFSMDSIASCAFGVDAKSFECKKTESPFVKNASSIFKRDITDIFRFSLFIIPFGTWIMKWFKIQIFKPKQTEYFLNIIKATLEQRTKSKERRNDLVDLMIDAMKDINMQETAEDEPEDQYEKDAKMEHKGKKSFNEITLVATAMTLMVAGYDTTGQTMSYICFELARNPKIQRRLQDEIDQAFADNDGEFPDYNTVLNLTYLDMVFMEALRLYPAVAILQRAATEDFKIPNTNLTIKKGEEIAFNIGGMHNDPEHFPNPEEFNPEHFSKEGKARRHPYSFAGFGHGPRNCLGMRFAMLEAKIALVAMLSKYDFVPSAGTIKGKVVFNPQSAFGAPKDGLHIKMKERAY